MANLEARLREDGYYECEFVDERGKTAKFIGATAEIAIAKVKKYIEGHGVHFSSYAESDSQRYSYRSKYGHRDRSTSHAQWGRPTRQQSDYRFGIIKVFGEIHAKAVMASSAAAAAVNVKVTEESAKKLLANVYNQRGKYNTYTGNLERAYMATVVSGRKAKKTYYLDDTPAGNKVESYRGKDIVRIFEERHKVGRVKPNQYKRYRNKQAGRADREYKRKFRYFKKWERKDGYRMKSILAERGGNVSGFGRMAGDKLNRVQSGIIIENTAPYAGAVQAKGYQVLPTNAALRSYSVREGHRQQQMAMILTKNMLHAAKLI